MGGPRKKYQRDNLILLTGTGLHPITMNVSKFYINIIKMLVKEGFYASQSEFCRIAIGAKLISDQSKIREWLKMGGLRLNVPHFKTEKPLPEYVPVKKKKTKKKTKKKVKKKSGKKKAILD